MAEKQTTTYVVLERKESLSPGDAEAPARYNWVECAAIEARSGRDAIRQYANDNGVTKGGVFYAVPQRSWNPTVVAVETQTRLKLT